MNVADCKGLHQGFCFCLFPSRSPLIESKNFNVSDLFFSFAGKGSWRELASESSETCISASFSLRKASLFFPRLFRRLVLEAFPVLELSWFPSSGPEPKSHITRVFPSFIRGWPSFLLLWFLTAAQKDSPFLKAFNSFLRPSSNIVRNAWWAASMSSDVESKHQHFKSPPRAIPKDLATSSAFTPSNTSAIFGDVSCNDCTALE